MEGKNKKKKGWGRSSRKHTEGASHRSQEKIATTKSKHCASENVSYVKIQQVKAEKERKPVLRFDKKSWDVLLPMVKKGQSQTAEIQRWNKNRLSQGALTRLKRQQKEMKMVLDWDF